MLFVSFNYSSLSYIVLALTSAITDLPNTIFTFYDFPGPTIEFHAFPDLENENEISCLSRISMTRTNPARVLENFDLIFKSLSDARFP